MDKKIYFVYIDECITPEIDMASLTALVTPIDKYWKIRTDFCEIILEINERIFSDKPIYKKFEPPFLHANSLLRNSKKDNRYLDFSSIDDDFRIYIFHRIVKLISKNDLFVVRLGYDNFREITSTIPGDPKLYKLNWHDLSATLSRSFPDGLLIPIMDGIDSEVADIFSSSIWRSNFRTEVDQDIHRSLIYNDPFNFIGNVFYAKSRYTEGLQLVDIISYLLQKKDYVRKKNISGTFSNKIITALDHLKAENVYDSILTVVFGNNENSGG